MIIHNFSLEEKIATTTKEKEPKNKKD